MRGFKRGKPAKAAMTLIVALFLVLAVMACQGPAGTPGTPGTPGKPGPAGTPGTPGTTPSAPPAPDPIVPDTVGEIEDMILKVGWSDTVDVKDNFDELQDQDLTYSATTDMLNIATATADGSMVTVTAVAKGEATVTVTATDEEDGEAKQTFTVTVTEKMTLAPVGRIDDVTTYEGDTETVDVRKAFNITDDRMTYEADSANDLLATAKVEEGTSVVTIKAERTTGDAGVFITVTATDPGGDTTGQVIRVFIMPASAKPVIPEPVAPMRSGTIPPKDLIKGGDPVTLDVAEFFTPREGLMYVAASDDDLIATASIAEGSSKVVITATGTAIIGDNTGITVTASGDAPPAAEQRFRVFVVAPPEPDTAPSFATDAAVVDPTYTVGEAIASLTLPAATGGNGDLRYSLDPQVPGLTFDPTAQVLTGTPSTAGAYDMTYTVMDADENMDAGDADELMFTITVESEETEDPDDMDAMCDPLALDSPDEKKTCEVMFPENQTLQAVDRTIVDVMRKSGSSTAWTITALKRGVTDIEVYEGRNNRIEDETFPVTVNNSPPKRTKMSPKTNDIETPMLDVGGDCGTEDMCYYSIMDTKLVEQYFIDADHGVSGHKLDYMPERVSSDFVIVRKVEAGKITFDVVATLTSEFEIDVYAIDDKKERSESVTLTVKAVKPAMWKYDVSEQVTDVGSFTTPKVGLRTGQTHQLIIDLMGETDAGRFEFFTADLSPPVDADGTAAVVTGPVALGLDDPPMTDADPPVPDGSLYVMVESMSPSISLPDDPIPMPSGSAPDLTVTIPFTVERADSAARIKFTYFVAYDADQLTAGDTGATAANDALMWHKQNSQYLTVNVDNDDLDAEADFSRR